MPAFTRVHPRYTIALLVSFFICILYLFNANSGPGGLSRPYPPSMKSRPQGLHVSQQLRLSESYYREHVRNRQKFIETLGPTPDLIPAFPPSSARLYTLWDFFLPAFPCPHHVQRVGTLGDGGKWVCGLERLIKKPKCVIYSIGINDESSFEADLLNRSSTCEVWGYDFSVKNFAPEVSAAPFAHRAHFKPYALGGIDAHSPTDNPPVYTLSTLMRANGHTFIDLLKIDIEGAEFATLEALLSAFPKQLPFGQLQLEIHARDGEYANFDRFLGWWERLEAAGLRPFWTEPNLVYLNVVRGARPDLAEYSFINIKGDHDIISDAI